MTPAEFSAITIEKTHLYNENVISSIKYLQTFWEKRVGARNLIVKK